MEFNISDRSIGDNHPTFLIAEVAQTHDGSIDIAHKFVDAAADVGVDAIKFQTHIASAESTLDEPFRVKFSSQDSSRYAYWKRMEFTPEQWKSLADHAHEKNLIFLSSAFSLEAIDLLERIGIPAWKVASGESNSTIILDRMAETRKPMLISTGMSNWHDIDCIVDYAKGKSLDFVLLQCTSKYPTHFEDVGINILDNLNEKYECLVGLSDHSGSVWPAILSIAKGASIVELHITLSDTMRGPDVSSSLNIEEFKKVVEARDAFFILRHNPINKDLMANDLENLRVIFSRSLAPVKLLTEGTVLKKEDLTLKKPGTGISPGEIENIIGSKLIRDVSPKHILNWSDIVKK